MATLRETILTVHGNVQALEGKPGQATREELVKLIGELAEKARVPIQLNGIRVRKLGTTIMIPLPRELWRPLGGDNQCWCTVCLSRNGGQSNPLAYWDTLSVTARRSMDHTWTVHAPELQ